MCAVFGFASERKLTAAEQRLALSLMHALAEFSMGRGRDAAGFAAATVGGELMWHRVPGPANEVFAGEEFAALRRRDIQMFIGHDRLATNGAPARNGNNHPHVVGDWAIVHNGVVRHHVHSAAVMDIDLETECDSELLAHLMARYGREQGPRVCMAMAGSQSVLALNPKEMTLLAWTDGNMPLVRFAVPGHPAWFFASTREIALVAAEAVGVDIEFAPVRAFAVYCVQGKA